MEQKENAINNKIIESDDNTLIDLSNLPQVDKENAETRGKLTLYSFS